MDKPTPTGRPGWNAALVAAIPVTLVVLSLFYYWFAVANRYVVFLYGHSATGIKLTQPFDEMTSSRYWMAGLVATAIVWVLYTAANLLLGRIAARRHRPYTPPRWWQVWVLCTPLLAVGISLITMRANAPTLPAPLAAACVAVTLAGLALALAPGETAAARPSRLLWLAGDGLGLVWPLLFVRVVELPGRGLSIGVGTVWVVAIASVVLCAFWLAIMGALRSWRRTPVPSAVEILAAGCTLAYLLAPLLHHLQVMLEGYPYITNSANFFASQWGLQLASWAVVALLAAGFTRLRRRPSQAKPSRPTATG